jgi:pimeloyl-ACP methyl ester carboxylesterase
MELNYKKYGEQGEHLIILHGLFGMLDNWHSLATVFSRDFQVWIIDQRNHGKSPHSEAFDYHLLAKDILDFCEEHGIEKMNLIGHSMGGKVAMQFSFMFPERLHKLIIADIAPKGYDGSHDELMDAMRNLNLSKISRRSDAEEMLEPQIPSLDVRQFLLKNLARQTEGYHWKLNLQSLEDNYPKIIGSIDRDKIYDGPVLFIKGGNSDYILPEDEKEILWQFPQAKFVTFPGIGHWVHAEAPALFAETVNGFLLSE